MSELEGASELQKERMTRGGPAALVVQDHAVCITSASCEAVFF